MGLILPSYPDKPSGVAVVLSQKRVGGKRVVDGAATERRGYRPEVFLWARPSSWSSFFLQEGGGGGNQTTNINGCVFQATGETNE